MTNLMRVVAFASLSIAVAPFSALGQEDAPSKIAWKGIDLQSHRAVEWVYEGCAAYPVTIEEISTDDVSSQLETERQDQRSQATTNIGSLDPVK